MTLTISEFFAAILFFLGFCWIFLGSAVFWVIPCGLLLTCVLMWVFTTKMNTERPDVDQASEGDRACQQTTIQNGQQSTSSHCQGEKR